MTVLRWGLSLGIASVCLAAAPRADVIDSSPSGFTVKIAVDINAAPQAVYQAIAHIGAWWSSSHTFSGSAANLSIDLTPGGCFCEKLPSGGGVKHMTVASADPGRRVLMHGGMGPMLSMAVTGAMDWALANVAGKTHLTLTYVVGGYAPGGVDAIAKPADGMLTEQVGRLKKFVETGKPD